jgi:lipid II:glycine glycyltransferase (peptidoglycan interpeptide bridge formation enzyme)
MKIIDITREEFLQIQSESQVCDFLQSFHWAKIQEEIGYKVFFEIYKDASGLSHPFILIEKKLFSGYKYYYMPRGLSGLDSYENFFLNLKNRFSSDKKLLFIRFEALDKSFDDYWPDCSFLSKISDIQPSKTLVLDLNLSEEDLLSEMKQKTRYNIRLSYKKGVEVLESDISNFDDFWRLMSLTSERDNFFIHDKNYYYNIINYNNKVIRLFEARFEGKLLAVGIFSFYGKKVSYLHGASSNSYRNLMAPYLLQWEVIKRSKEEGFLEYDFYGVDEDKWPGVSRFKKGFGGDIRTFPGSFDYINKFKAYNFYRILRFLKRKIKKIL